MAAETARRIIPLLDRVLVSKIKPNVQTKSGLFLPDSAKTGSNQATVLAVGEGKINKETGKKTDCCVKVGDTVIVPDYGGMHIKLDDHDFHIFRNDDIIAILQPSAN